jgi:hypothetical protein
MRCQGLCVTLPLLAAAHLAHADDVPNTAIPGNMHDPTLKR